MTDGKMARALGAAGIGIGITELVAPHWINKKLGVRDRPALTRMMGAREIASGVSIFAGRETEGQWARVVGDLVDIALLGLAIKQSRKRGIVVGVLGAIAAITALDVLTARRLQRL